MGLKHPTCHKKGALEFLTKKDTKTRVDQHSSHTNNGVQKRTRIYGQNLSCLCGDEGRSHKLQ